MPDTTAITSTRPSTRAIWQSVIMSHRERSSRRPRAVSPKSPVQSPGVSWLGRPAPFYTLAVAAIALGTGWAVSKMWVCDDAFISYRYARNLVDGKGLVFNAGERVEGYTNLLWTLWCAVGLLLRRPVEQWSMVWGIACYAASLALLAYFACLRRQLTHGPWLVWLPIAAILGAAHEDWAVFATSGLETSLFTALALAGFVVVAHGAAHRRQYPLVAGLLMTLCALTRPEGMIFAVVLGAGLAWIVGWKWRPIIVYAAAFLVPQAAYFIWRGYYYGDFLPNTYYAKSGNLAWWDQGFHYLELYLYKYWILGLSVIGAIVLCLPDSRDSSSSEPKRVASRLGLTAAAMAAAYVLFVTRVGGDFMFARMLIPTTPFLLITIELGASRLLARQAWGQVALVVGMTVALIVPNYPMTKRELLYGVANERSYYGDYLLYETASEILRKYLADLPVNVAFMGSEAQRMYRGRIPIAIESEAGLTDRFVAHQPLASRGRVGHEKTAPLDYLIRVRKAHFVFHPAADAVLGLTGHIPLSTITLDGLSGYILHWDPAIMSALRQRGARFDDFPAYLDQVIAKLPSTSDERIAQWYPQLRLFYFEQVKDPTREEPFLRRLAKKEARVEEPPHAPGVDHNARRDEKAHGPGDAGAAGNREQHQHRRQEVEAEAVTELPPSRVVVGEHGNQQEPGSDP